MKGKGSAVSKRVSGGKVPRYLNLLSLFPCIDLERGEKPLHQTELTHWTSPCAMSGCKYRNIQTNKNMQDRKSLTKLIMASNSETERWVGKLI